MPGRGKMADGEEGSVVEARGADQVTQDSIQMQTPVKNDLQTFMRKASYYLLHSTSKVNSPGGLIQESLLSPS